MEARCKNCVYWKEDETRDNAHECKSGKLVYGGDLEDDGIPHDGVRYDDYEGYEAYLHTGPDFGCVHFKHKVIE